MIRHSTLEHRFVAQFPEKLEPGILYVSVEYGSVAHSCCCGCGEEVVTPLGPTDWHIIYDGEAITLKPSVGSWTLPCKSHYVIRRGIVIEAPSWSKDQIANERKRDQRAKALYFGNDNSTEHDLSDPQVVPTEAAADIPRLNFLERIRSWWSGLKW